MKGRSSSSQWPFGLSTHVAARFPLGCVAPIGKDCTTTAIELGLDPKRTVAVDLTGDVPVITRQGRGPAEIFGEFVGA